MEGAGDHMERMVLVGRGEWLVFVKVLIKDHAILNFSSLHTYNNTDCSQLGIF